MNTVSKCCNPEVKGEGKDCSIGSFGMDERLNAECLSMPTEQATEKVEKPAEGKVGIVGVEEIIRKHMHRYEECMTENGKIIAVGEMLIDIKNWHTAELERERERIAKEIEVQIFHNSKECAEILDTDGDRDRYDELADENGGLRIALKIVQSAGKKL